MHNLVDVLVLNWNGHQLTERCLGALSNQSYPQYRVRIIDNGSTDESVYLLSVHQSTTCSLLQLPTNRGFAGGMNAGLRQSLACGADYIWILNNDALPEPDCLSALVEFMDSNPIVGGITPRLLGLDGIEQHAGGRLRLSNGENCPLRSADLSSSLEDSDWLTGTALLVRSSALRQVGLFDCNFFAYWEDVDLCFRLRSAGFGLRAIPDAVCLHLGNASTGGIGNPFARYMSTRNGLYFLRKHLPYFTFLTSRIGFASNWLERMGIMEQQNNRDQGIAILRGLYAGFLGEKGRPSRLRTPVPFEGFLMKHPWRFQQLLRTCHIRLTGLLSTN